MNHQSNCNLHDVLHNLIIVDELGSSSTMINNSNDAVLPRINIEKINDSILVHVTGSKEEMNQVLTQIIANNYCDYKLVEVAQNDLKFQFIFEKIIL